MKLKKKKMERPGSNSLHSHKAVVSMTEDKARFSDDRKAAWTGVCKEGCQLAQNPRHKILLSLTTDVTASLSHFNVIPLKS